MSIQGLFQRERSIPGKHLLLLSMFLWEKRMARSSARRNRATRLHLLAAGQRLRLRLHPGTSCGGLLWESSGARRFGIPGGSYVHSFQRSFLPENHQNPRGNSWLKRMGNQPLESKAGFNVSRDSQFSGRPNLLKAASCFTSFQHQPNRGWGGRPSSC